MTTNEFQELCAKTVNDIDAKYNIVRDPQLCFVQLVEEVGELAKEINKPKIRGEKIDQENLKGEFADVTLLLFALAKMLDVKIEEATEEKNKILKGRHNL